MKTQSYEFDSYRSFLKACLAERIESNANYSLRSMAKYLGVSSSTLSEVINGRANLSLASAGKIALRLNLKSSEAKYFLGLVQLEAAKNPLVKEQILENLKSEHPKKREVCDLTLEQFRQMADWQHSAILELGYLKNFKFTAENTAKKLGISKPMAELAIERLVKLELLEINEKGELSRVHPDLKVQSDVKNAAMKQYYEQMLGKISEALDTQTPKERLSGYLNMPIDKKALPEIDAAIDGFFNELKDISAKHKNKTEVYHLSLHFINLIKEKL